MKIDLEEIRDLVLQEILGTLTDKDRVILEQSVAMDDRAKSLREEMMAKAKTPEVLSRLSEHNDQDYTGTILSTFKKRRRSRTAIQLVSLSAIVTLCAAAFWTFSERQTEKAFSKESHNRSKESHIAVLLPSGEIFNLDSSNRQFKSGTVNLNTSNMTLTYSSKDKSSSQFASIIVPAGKDYKLKLEDGSEIQLNSASEVRFALKFADNKREISIKGEAYIKVAPNSSKPFYVTLPNGTIQVLGTEFNVNTYDAGVNKIALINGSLKLRSSIDSVLLKPGSEALQTSKGITVNDFDPSEVLAWREGKYYFSDARLDEVCRVISRWYGTDVMLDNKSVGGERFTGVIYRNQPVDYLLTAIKATNYINYYKDNQGIIHIK
jgi:ferric-dicitrate binding protein FerR (iron transport regulator)